MATFTSIVVLGASGDLASKKIFPALFNLFVEGDIILDNTAIFGFARTDMSNEAFRDRIAPRLLCRLHTEKQTHCENEQPKFLNSLSYVSGSYVDESGFKALDEALKEREAGRPSRRIWYMAIPPYAFKSISNLIHLHARGDETALVVEKPIGKDTKSFIDLNEALLSNWNEHELYRIDHYLGKEMIQDLITLRFANLLIHSSWSRQFIKKIDIEFAEQIDAAGRGAYFDSYGIVRDVIQNHLFQILTLICMERPVSLDSDDIMAEKVKVLRTTTLKPESVTVGQYEGYVDDPTVADDSKTPTFCKMSACVNNERWAGVPINLSAGKSLSKTQTCITVHYDTVPGTDDLFPGLHNCNKLIIVVQPNERIELRLINKKPGVAYDLSCSPLNLLYRDEYGTRIPEAYERLLLDVMNGDQSFFVQSQEAEIAWKIFDPLLEKIDRGDYPLKVYSKGSSAKEIVEQ